MKILLNGAQGRMGQAIQRIAEEFETEVALTLDRDDSLCTAQLAAVDLAIDFSHHSATAPLLQAALAAGRPILIGTTGHSPAEREAIIKASQQLPVMWAGNYSVGITLLLHYTEQLARQLGPAYHPEVIEMHHHRKVDAPSGTAENLVAALLRGRDWSEEVVRHGRSGITGQRPAEEIGVHAIRGGEIVGEHTVLFAGTGERLELTHRAADRRIFAEGALRAARWLVSQAAGLYDMRDVLGIKQ